MTVIVMMMRDHEFFGSDMKMASKCVVLPVNEVVFQLPTQVLLKYSEKCKLRD
jgi:hypothetical protein